MEGLFLNEISLGIALIGLLVIVWGLIRGLSRLVASEYSGLRGNDESARRQSLRHELGYYILLGLEFLVAADIVHTIIRPSLHELAILAGIVGIRTVISFSLNWELSQAEKHGAGQGR